MKLNNKGFTLVELLGVIVLLAIVMTIAVPSIMTVSKNIKKNMLETKIDLILEDAKLYGQDRISTIYNETTKHESYPCIKVKIGDLLDGGYLSSDKEDDEAGYVVNPVDNSSLNEKNIILYVKHKRVVATMADEELDGTEEKTCG